MRPILPITEPKCYSHDCGVKSKCARYLVEATPGRPAAVFLNPQGGCLNAIPVGSLGQQEPKKPHEPIKGIC